MSDMTYTVTVNVAYSGTILYPTKSSIYGSFIKTDGSTGSIGEVTGHIGDINLIDDTFHREFSDTLDTSNLAESLPDMQGSEMAVYHRKLHNLNHACSRGV